MQHVFGWDLPNSGKERDAQFEIHSKWAKRTSSAQHTHPTKPVPPQSAWSSVAPMLACVDRMNAKNRLPHQGYNVDFFLEWNWERHKVRSHVSVQPSQKNAKICRTMRSSEFESNLALPLWLCDFGHGDVPGFWQELLWGSRWRRCTHPLKNLQGRGMDSSLLVTSSAYFLWFQSRWR